MKRSKFSLSNYKLLSCDMGELVPIGLMEVLPGDSIQHATSALIRCSPMLAPVMHPVHARIHHWYVPHRLVWDSWEDFITGGPTGENESPFPVIIAPAADPTGFEVGSLADYLGVPTGVPSLEVSALPFRGYNLIYNEWYRDQDLIQPANIDKGDGLDTITDTSLLTVAWEKDYFTSSRPWEQKGPAITIPLGTEAPVTGIGNLSTALYNQTSGTAHFTGGVDSILSAGNPFTDDTTAIIQEDPDNPGYPNIKADLSGASAITINLLREAFALQRFEEARARYGSRYTEYLRYLGVRSSDARLQRPEYLGGGKQTIQFSEVVQTAEGSDPVGELRGHGIGALRSNRYRRFFEEHGYVYTFISVRPKTIYTQGLPRTWNRRTKEDFWQRELQHIGQQEVKLKEVYATGVAGTDPGEDDYTFGWQDRYDEYRRTESTIAGEFRTTLLNYWHMAREFGSAPTLNEAFVECLPTDRIFAVGNLDNLYIMANHNVQARRIVAKTGTSFIF